MATATRRLLETGGNMSSKMPSSVVPERDSGQDRLAKVRVDELMEMLDLGLAAATAHQPPAPKAA